MEKVSTDGVITVEESKTAETYSEVVEGMMFDRGYIAPYMVTDTDKMVAELDDCLILLLIRRFQQLRKFYLYWNRLFRQVRNFLLLLKMLKVKH
ncbi:MAG: hypothetical protein ACLRX1_02070 [Ruminococcus sp.]